MVQVARDRTSGCVNIVDIADREALSVAYVAKLLRLLRKAGFVKSTRGVKGGYQTTRPAEEICVADILSALGGDLYTPDFCHRHSGHARDCVHILDCGGRAMFMGLDRVVKAYLSQFKLSDLVHPERELREMVGERVEELPRRMAGSSV
jgi:Rrf2 family protein